MTQSVSFPFSSPHFTFTSAKWRSQRRAAVLRWRVPHGTHHERRCGNVLVEGPIEFDALLGELTIVVHADGRTRAANFARLTGQLRDLRVGHIRVIVESAVLIIVKVVDADERPLGGITVSLNLPDWEPTSETTTDARGEIAVLANAGRHDATIGFVDGRRLWPPVKNHVDIAPTDVGERVLLLRVPA